MLILSQKRKIVNTAQHTRAKTMGNVENVAIYGRCGGEIIRYIFGKAIIFC